MCIFRLFVDEIAVCQFQFSVSSATAYHDLTDFRPLLSFQQIKFHVPRFICIAIIIEIEGSCACCLQILNPCDMFTTAVSENNTIVTSIIVCRI